MVTIQEQIFYKNYEPELLSFFPQAFSYFSFLKYLHVSELFCTYNNVTVKTRAEQCAQKLV